MGINAPLKVEESIVEKEKQSKKNFIVTGMLLLLFVIYTIMVMTVDVQAIGPEESKVGFATINGFFHNLIGVNMVWYTITKITGILDILVILAMAALGAFQLIKRKDFFKVDKDLLILGMFYILVAMMYVLFEVWTVNYRPVILDQGLEASYPSSHSMLAICAMIPAIMQINRRIKDETIRKIAVIAALVIMVITVGGRFLSGVHWFTDIVGGILLGSALTMIYYSMIKYIFPSKKRSH